MKRLLVLLSVITLASFSCSSTKQTQNPQAKIPAQPTSYKLAYINENNRVIFDGKDLGEYGFYPDIPEFNIFGSDIFWYRAFPEPTQKLPRLIFNAKDFGVANEAYAKDGDIYYTKMDGSKKEFVYKNDKQIGVINNLELTYTTANPYPLSNFVLADKGHYAFQNDKQHIIYDGKDLGAGWGVKISEDNIIYAKDNGAASQAEIIYNGKSLGATDLGLTGFSGSNYVYDNQDGHFIYNGVDVGQGEAMVPPRYILSASHFAFYKAGKNKYTDPSHLILDGKDLSNPCGRKSPTDQNAFLDTIRFIGDNFIQYCANDSSGYLGHIFINNKDVGMGDHISLQFDGSNYVYVRENLSDDKLNVINHIIYNGQDMGEGYAPQVSGGHLVFGRIISPGAPEYQLHVIYDGKDMGQHNGYSILNEYFAYSKNVDSINQIIIDGKVFSKGIDPVLFLY